MAGHVNGDIVTSGDNSGQPGGRQARRGGPGFFSGGPDGPDRPELSFVEPRLPEIRASKYVNTSDMISAVEASS